MNAPIVTRLRRVTDALAAAVRAPEVDLDAVLQLLARREQLLAAVPVRSSAQELLVYRALLEEIQAVDAEVRSCLEERLLRVRQDLRALTSHVRSPRRRQSAAGFLDRHV